MELWLDTGVLVLYGCADVAEGSLFSTPTKYNGSIYTYAGVDANGHYDNTKM